jgi:hypothetical protein
MPVEIVNLTKRGIMINTIKTFLAAEGSVVRPDAVKDDPDVQELVSAEMIRLQEPSRKAGTAPKAEQARPAEKKGGTRDKRGQSGRKEGAKQAAKEVAPEDQMGRNAVIMDRGVPVNRKMNPGLHSTKDPIVPQGEKPEAEEDEKSSAFVDIT